MKLQSNFYGFCLLAFIICGCSSSKEKQVVEDLRKIPEYSLPTSVVYDTSAKCYVPSIVGLESESNYLSDELKSCGFHIFSNDDFYKATPIFPNFIIECIYRNTVADNYLDGLAVYGQIIVRVRRPASLTNDKVIASFGEKPRDFQAIGRYIVSDRKQVTSEDYDKAIRIAVKNLMQNPCFREALQEFEVKEPSSEYGMKIHKTSSPSPSFEDLSFE